MIIYNKQLQKIFDVDIEPYKIISGKYKIGDKNGKGKEYLLKTNVLIFEGEYKNGRKNGKGREYYDNGELKFEGEYLSGKIWNGKIYNKYDKNVFEIKEGKGNVKDYDKYNLKFEGEINGQGKEYYNKNKIKFEGEYINGERNGKGKEYYDNGKLKFEGDYLNGKIWNGKLYNKYNKKVFEIKEGKGNIKDYDICNLKFKGQINGKGK